MKKASHAADELPVLSLAHLADWERWLAEHQGTSPGVWLRIGKAGSRAASALSYAQALEAALCQGWIDSQKRAQDEQAWLQKFGPRGPRSIWSKINRDKALALIACGRMQPAGLRQVSAAQLDGRWQSAYDGQGRAEVPDDLQAALAASPRARAFFEALDSRNRYAILFRIHNLKRAETRARNIAKFVQMLERHEKIHR